MTVDKIAIWNNPAWIEGYNVAALPPEEQTACPYPKNTEAHDAWWEGYSDYAEDVIADNSQP